MPTVISHLCGGFFSEHRGSLFLFLLISQVFHGFYHICFSLDLTVRLSNSFPTNYLNLPQILSILFGFFANLSIYFSNSSSQNTGTRHKSLAVLSSFIFYSSIIKARSIKKGLPQFVLVSENNTLIIPVTAARCLQRGYMGTAWYLDFRDVFWKGNTEPSLGGRVMSWSQLPSAQILAFPEASYSWKASEAWKKSSSRVLCLPAGIQMSPWKMKLSKNYLFLLPAYFFF